jgi:hypothetical protein
VEKTNVSKTISVLILRVLMRELPGKQQILHALRVFDKRVLRGLLQLKGESGRTLEGIAQREDS